MIADGHFLDAQLPFGGLHGNLGLESEAVGANGDALEQVCAENLIAGFHVREIQVTEHAHWLEAVAQEQTLRGMANEVPGPPATKILVIF
jgi:hypothetical protein